MLHLFRKKSRNNGAFADFLDKRKGKGKGNLVMKSTPKQGGLVQTWVGFGSFMARFKIDVCFFK